MIVVLPPDLDTVPCVIDRGELVHGQIFIAQLTVEGRDRGVFPGLSGSDEVELHTVTPSPFVQRPRGELRAVIQGDRLG